MLLRYRRPAFSFQNPSKVLLVDRKKEEKEKGFGEFGSSYIPGYLSPSLSVRVRWIWQISSERITTSDSRETRILEGIRERMVTKEF
jgi:hypothetical protein